VRLLLTRPESDAARTAAALTARGHTVVIAPLLRIEPVAEAVVGAGPWAAILVTSANAAQAMDLSGRHQNLAALPVFAAGERSAQAMRTKGFAEVTSADGDVTDLARLVAARIKPGASLLYLAARDRAGDLAAALAARSFTVDTAVVYRAVTVDRLPAVAADALAGGIDGVLHFSRRSAEAYLRSAKNGGLLEQALAATHFCLSAQVAGPLQRAGAGTVHVAARPQEAALLALIGRV
jgi:uroporphyrinogen-III synthase